MVSLHLVEGAADVETTVVEFRSQLVHEDVEGLGSGRIEASREEESYDTLAQGTWSLAPQVVAQSLCLGAGDVEHVESEHQLCLQQEQHFLLLECDEIAGCQRTEGGCEALCDTKEIFRLQGVGGVDLFYDAAGMIVALSLGRE